MSLKDQLNNLIEKGGYVTLNQVYAFAASIGVKQKTAERELNPSRSPNILTVKNDKHQIVAYKWLLASNSAPSATFTHLTPTAQAFLTKWTPKVQEKVKETGGLW